MAINSVSGFNQTEKNILGHEEMNQGFVQAESVYILLKIILDLRQLSLIYKYLDP